KDWKVNLSYNFTHGTHLDRTLNLNVTDPGELISNAANAITVGVASPGTNPLTITAPSGSGCVNTPQGSYDVVASQILAAAFTQQNGGGTPPGSLGTAS